MRCTNAGRWRDRHSKLQAALLDPLLADLPATRRAAGCGPSASAWVSKTQPNNLCDVQQVRLKGAHRGGKTVRKNEEENSGTPEDLTTF